MEKIAIYTRKGSLIHSSEILENLFEFDERLNRSILEVKIQGKEYTLDKHWSTGISICDAKNEIVGEVRYGDLLHEELAVQNVQEVFAKFF